MIARAKRPSPLPPPRGWLPPWAAALLTGVEASAQGLPSWNDGPVKRAVIEFVERVTRHGDADCIPPEDRIAVFDDDGTLWVEQPICVQLAFALDRIRTLAPQHPEWKETPPFKAVLEGDPTALATAGDKGVAAIVAATHAWMTTDAFAATVAEWLATARHPRFGRPYDQLVYRPMVELLAYLRANGFKTFLISGGGVELMRVFAERAYGIPPEQVIGSSAKTEFHVDASGTPVLVKSAAVELIDDGPGKPAGIDRFIGRRPVLAFGNSDGDRQMLQWTAGQRGPHLVGLVHHTDAGREYAYDRASHVGTLDAALDEALARRWMLIDMRRDWGRVFP
jgi:phosphoglycolate phosphatase-like HAD superfamily hydrolase